MSPEDSSGRYPCIMSVLEVLRELTSFLLKGTTKHENDQLRKWLSRPPKTRKDLPEDIELDSC